MKRSYTLTCLLFLVLILSSVGGASPTYAQGGGSHDAILAAIPTLLNFAEQVPNTFVGEVESSYAYIAFVIQDNLVVIYVCDGVGVSEWIKTEIVDGVISATTENGVVIQATVTDTSVNGTAVLPIDDDGTPVIAHNFTTAPAVPGTTGLARYVDDATVSGWIVTENGSRGFRKRRQEREHQEQCNQWNQDWNTSVEVMQAYPQGSTERDYWFNYAYNLAGQMIQNGCGAPVPTS